MVNKMYKKIIIHALIFSFLYTGCYSWEIVQEPDPNSTIKVTIKKNEVYEMSFWQANNEQIIGYTDETVKEGKITKNPLVKIKKEDIYQYEEAYVDGIKTIILSTGIVAMLFLTFMLAWEVTY